MKKHTLALLFAILLLAPSYTFGTTYYSIASGNWGSASTWSTTGCGGAAGASTPGSAAGDVVVICNGFTVTVAANPANSIASVTVQNGGYLICGGTGGGANKQFTITAGGTFTIDNGGTYEHNTTNAASTSVFAGTESFAAASTIIITKWSSTATSIITGCGSNFGNLTLNYNTGAFFWNCDGLGYTRTIQGTLNIGSSCTIYCNSTAGNITVTIGGDLIVSSSISIIKYNVTGDVILNVTGNTTINSTGVFYVKYQNTGNATMTTASFSNAGTFIGVSTAAGSFNFTASSFTMTAGTFRGVDGSGGAGNCTMIINGNWTHSGGQVMVINYATNGNFGVSTVTIHGSLTLTGGSIFWHRTDITDSRTCAITIDNDCSLTFASASDFMEFSNIVYTTNNAVYTLSVGGNFTIAGSTTGLFLTRYTNTGDDNIYVTGNLTLSGGTTSFAGGVPASAPVNKLYVTVGGHVSITGSAILYTESANNLSKIDLTVGTASVNWAQTSSGTVSLCNTNIKSGKTVTMTGTKMGDIQTSRTVTVETGGKLYCSNYPVSGLGLFTLSTGATLGIGSAAGIVSSGATGNIQVSGARSYNSGATYEYYEAISPQSTGNFTTTTTSGTYPSQVANLIINKTLGTNVVNLTNTTDVSTLLTLTSGVLTTSYTSATAPWVRIPSGASISPTGGSSSSYVDGYIRTNGTSAFTFPTGNGGKWRRISMLAPSVSTEFEARYVSSAYTNTSTFAASPTPILTHVSTVEHWFLTKPLGADAATTKVNLYWEDASASGIYTFDSLTVARWSGTDWENTNCYGSCPSSWLSSQPERTYTGGATGTSAGTIQSNTVSSFSPFTLGSIGTFSINPLPIELLSSEVTCNNNNVLISWSTATETSNNFFTIEKSIDGINFIKIGNINGAGNSSSIKNYSYIDYNAYSGISYYRLKQTDYNGDTKTFGMLTSENCNASTSTINAFNDQTGNISIIIDSEIESIYTAILYDALGKKVESKKYSANKGNNIFQFDISILHSGVYLISIDNGKEKSIKKILIF